jgi:gliding motility-associated-like protein
MKNLFLIITLLSCMWANAQTTQKVVSTLDEYQTAKLAGENPVLHQVMSVSSPIKPKVHPSAAKMGGGGQIGTDCQCIQPIDSTFAIAPFTNGEAPEYRNDDGSTAEIELPFTFCLYGQTYNSCFINNNGNISFVDPFSTFSSSAFPTADFRMVAPFWADVDTRNEESGLPYYKITETSLTVIWESVGYFNSAADKRNTFQVIITDGTDPIVPGGNNVSFCYGDMQWTTGSASQGVDGFGGTPATVGANSGDGLGFIQFGRFDAPGNNYDGPFNNADQVSWLDNLNFVFNTCIDESSTNIAPIIPSTSLCDTLYICAGSTISVQFIGPEAEQTITLTHEILGSNLLTTSETIVPGSSQLFITAPVGMLPDTLTLNVQGVDDGVPALANDATYVLIVIDEPAPIVITASEIELCQGEEANLSIPSFYTNVSWSTGAGSTGININEGGDYSVTASLGGCETTGNISILSLPSPLPTIGGEFFACEVPNTEIFVNEEYPSVTWSNNLSTDTIAVSTGNFTVTVVGDNGCLGTSAPVSVLVIAELNVTVNPIDFCVSDRPLNVTVPNAPAGLPLTYQWDPSVNLSSTTSASPNVQDLTESTTFSVTVFPTAYPDCQTTETVAVNVIELPEFTTDESVTYCNNGLELSTTATNPVAGLNYVWAWTPSNFFSDNSSAAPNLAGIIPTGTEVTGTLSVSWDPLCRTQETVIVDVPETPEVFPFVVDSMCLGSELLLFAGAQDFPVSYQWYYFIVTENNVDSIINLGTDAVQEVVTPGDFYLTATEALCGFSSNSQYIVFNYPCNIRVPNVFTPNGDGLNDFFEIEDLYLFPNSALKVFDRWGALVYESSNYTNNWDGKDLPGGTYFYIFDWQKDTDERISSSGNITLLRD